MEDAGVKGRRTFGVTFNGTDELCQCSARTRSRQENHTSAVEQEAVVGSFVCLCLSEKGRLTDIPEHE